MKVKSKQGRYMKMLSKASRQRTKHNNHLFGTRIRSRRRELNLTQEELARRVKVSIPYIGHLETDKRHPSEQMITRLAEALALDGRELFLLANPQTKELLSQQRDSDSSASWDAFCRNETLRRLHNITEQELHALSQVALLGNVRSPRDFLFILNTIRQAMA
jgi:transcriptional regulator with XRE-family HTH domain